MCSSSSYTRDPRASKPTHAFSPTFTAHDSTRRQSVRLNFPPSDLSALPLCLLAAHRRRRDFDPAHIEPDCLAPSGLADNAFQSSQYVASVYASVGAMLTITQSLGTFDAPTASPLIAPDGLSVVGQAMLVEVHRHYVVPPNNQHCTLPHRR